MKKMINILSFSICFLLALLYQAYAIFIRNWFAIFGIGAVVLILGYLLLDSMRSIWKYSLDQTKDMMEKLHQEERNHWSERYTQLENYQKATYTALKKHTALLNEHFEANDNRLNSLENNNEKVLQSITELQIKALDVRSPEPLLDTNEDIQAETIIESKDEINADIISPEIIPLYEDPYKELSNEEISKLFSSYGK